MNVKLTQEQKIKVLNSDDIYRIMQQVLKREKKIDRDKEHFWLVCLAQNNRILFIELISLGSVNATIVEPMDVFSYALQKRAVKLIMVHNHPSGELTPSQNDIELTDKLMAIGKFLKVPIIEHLIISETSYYSFVGSGLLKQIEANTHFDLTFKEVERLLVMLDNKGREIAKKLLAKEIFSIDEVAELTGLTNKQVQVVETMRRRKRKKG